MAHALDEARSKVRRARVHLKELHVECTKYLQAHPYALLAQNDKDGRLRRIFAQAMAPEEPVPDDVGVILGDVLHNLRSALDLLAWRLSKGDGSLDRTTQFPIVFDEPNRQYKKAPAQRFWDHVVHNQLARVSDEDRTLIERLQPYRGGHGHKLRVLALLNDMDKHRVIPARQATIYNPMPTLTGPNASIHGVVFRASQFQDLHDGAVLVEFHRPPGPDVTVDLKPPVFVLFGDPSGPRANEAHLWRYARWVELILRGFRNRV
jgi:hypothetical protein